MTPLDTLRHHVTGAIARGEATAIAAQTFYTGDDDCNWLLETALRGYTVPIFKSFTLEGNEDCPLRIRCYASSSPRHDAVPVYDVTLTAVGHGNLSEYRKSNN